MNADARLYASAIAIVSGTYSVASTVTGGMRSFPMSGSIMLVVGVTVLAHGIVLLTPAAERLGRASGPLMVLWAALMLGNQLLLGTMATGSPMRGGMMAWDGGMVAIAILMLASGLIMSRRRAQM